LQNVEESEEVLKERAELELILMDGDNTKHLSKPEVIEENISKSKKKRNKKKMAKLAKEKKQELEKEKEHFELDVNDKRFGALFTSHHFHIDPQAPQFTKTKNMMKLVDEQISRNKIKGKKRKIDTIESSLTSPTKKTVSQTIVESLKKKIKKQ